MRRAAAIAAVIALAPPAWAQAGASAPAPAQPTAPAAVEPAQRQAATSYRSFLALDPTDDAPRARALLAQPAPAPRRSRTLLLTLGGGALMAVGAGAFFGARSRSERATLHNERHVAYDVTQRENEMIDDAHRANLLFAVAAALAAAGAALFVLEF